MRVGADAFFASDGRYALLDRALELAIVLKCSPFNFLDLNDEQMALIYERAIVAFNRMKAASD